MYFRILHCDDLKSGDIVLMDEPAHKLSVPARKECMQLLREYGIKHGITFVIVTHDPHFVNVDHLDELRIVRERKDLKGSEIINDFSQIDSCDTDTLGEIKKAFGAGSHVFCEPSVRCIFVEGITDYNYLTTFKLLYEKEKSKKCNLIFLPIAGLGKKGDEKVILEKLMKQAKEPILLVDADGAGEALKKIANENNYESITIASFKDAGLNAKEIEDLFDDKDKECYALFKKSSLISAAFKKRILFGDNENSISQASKEKFYKLLEYLERDI